MSDFQYRQIVEENTQMLRARRSLLDARDGALLFQEEKQTHHLYESLSDMDIATVGDADFPLFSLQLNPADMRDVVPGRSSFSFRTEEDLIIYEANMLFLLNRWQKANEKYPDEVRFNTKKSQYDSLKKLTVSQLQALSNRGRLISRLCVSPKTLEALIINPYTRAERNQKIIIG